MTLENHKIMELQKKITGLQFTGDNFDKLKEFAPQLEKYEFRSKQDVERHSKSFEYKGYTVGWKIQDATFGESLTEALPGFWIIKSGGEYRILSLDEFEKEFK